MCLHPRGCRSANGSRVGYGLRVWCETGSRVNSAADRGRPGGTDPPLEGPQPTVLPLHHGRREDVRAGALTLAMLSEWLSDVFAALSDTAFLRHLPAYSGSMNLHLPKRRPVRIA